MKTLLGIIVLILVMVGVKAQTIPMQVFGDAPAVIGGTSTEVTVDNALRPYPQAVTDAVNAKGKVVAIEIEREVASRGFLENTIRTKIVLGAQYSQADSTVHAVRNLPPKDRSLDHGFGRWWLASLLCMILAAVIAWRASGLAPSTRLGVYISISIAIANIAYIAAIVALTAALLAAEVISAGILLVGILVAIVITVKSTLETKDKNLLARGLKIASLLFLAFAVVSLPAFLYF